MISSSMLAAAGAAARAASVRRGATAVAGGPAAVGAARKHERLAAQVGERQPTRAGRAGDRRRAPRRAAPRRATWRCSDGSPTGSAHDGDVDACRRRARRGPRPRTASAGRARSAAASSPNSRTKRVVATTVVASKPIRRRLCSPRACASISASVSAYSASTRRPPRSSDSPAAVSCDAARRAAQQLDAELALERPDRRAQRRLRDPEPPRGAAEVELLGDRDEVAQQPQLAGDRRRRAARRRAHAATLATPGSAATRPTTQVCRHRSVRSATAAVCDRPTRDAIGQPSSGSAVMRGR